ncbi:MAG TPA: phosphoribosylformylglycinamidine synthase subunit PurL [Atribacteraceae bacterium]|nr:phosphoribosylformylglycinamidine synthase subunit PurL [Atribacteraceae bacterium]
MIDRKPATIARELGLREEEYHRVCSILNREPTPTELAMFSVEWSEHCGYPHSRRWFELFPREGAFPSLIGEDAGGIVHDGIAIVFKMESHNHPSQVEPRQGAATGIGGIIRDIFGSGARPIACLDSLRFGPVTNAHSRHVFQRVVEGIAFYGNCVGVPTVAGEVSFFPCYQGNCLVNVMCVGLAARESLAKAWAKGVGNVILYAGNRTGRDGIGGCSILASQEFGVNEEKRPSVQIGDPFTEKCLIEATLEALEHGSVVGIKDMGAAGLTCSASEMAASGECGVTIDLARVPMREERMEPWEIMMSESQERMLLCVERGREKEILDIFHKWGLESAVIGWVTEGDHITVLSGETVVADIPARELVNPPQYTPPAAPPDYLARINGGAWRTIPVPPDLNEVLRRLVVSPNLVSRKWVFQQYDHMVGINTARLPGTGTVVLRVKEKTWGIAVTTDCNPLWCYLDPREGAKAAVAEAARNLASCGARPAGVTDCLNFGNPQKSDRYWQFIESVRGLSEACRAFDLPVVSGNVSFYNESPDGPIFPTPTVGMVGIIDDVNQAISAFFGGKDHLVALLGETREDLGGSEYLRFYHNREEGPIAPVDLSFEKNLQELLREAAEKKLLLSANDLSEGGLALALLESALCGDRPIGVVVDLAGLSPIRKDALVFGESPGRVLVCLHSDNWPALSALAKTHHVPLFSLGKTGGKDLIIKIGGRSLIHLSLEDLARAWNGEAVLADGSEGSME